MKIGSVVALPSGSPKMTVIKIDDGTVTVLWINYDTHESHTLTLPKEAVVSSPKPGTVTASAPPWTPQQATEHAS